jgi:four helix bundle protein
LINSPISTVAFEALDPKHIDAWRSLRAFSLLKSLKGQQMTDRGDELEERLLEFAARVGKVVDSLPNTRLGRHIAGQLVRSGTSPAPNYSEACGAESKKDFIHKLGISLKELRESRCWLRLILKADLLPENRLADLLDEANQLCKIVAKSIVTARSNNRRKQETD